MNYTLSPLSLKHVKQSTFNALIGDCFSPAAFTSRDFTENKAVAPRVDIYDAEKEYRILVDLPGFEKESIKLDIKHGELLLEALRSSNSEKETSKKKGVERESKMRIVRQERADINFARRFSFNETVDLDAVSAQLKDGVLTISIPKGTEPSARTVTIN